MLYNGAQWRGRKAVIIVVLAVHHIPTCMIYTKSIQIMINLRSRRHPSTQSNGTTLTVNCLNNVFLKPNSCNLSLDMIYSDRFSK